MDPLFSHAPQDHGDPSAHGEVPPSRAYRWVLPAPRDIVYRAFVGDIHLWWPSAYTGFGEGTHAFIEDGLVGEEGDDGRMQVWGEVLNEEPAERLEIAWTLAWRPDVPTRVRVDFADTEGGTLVTFVHDGWASGAEGVQQYEKYGDWPLILGRFAAFFGQSAESVERL